MESVIDGKKIVELRKKKGMTQKELAKELNVSDKTISKIECGNIIPDIELEKKLMEFLCPQKIKNEKIKFNLNLTIVIVGIILLSTLYFGINMNLLISGIFAGINSSTYTIEESINFMWASLYIYMLYCVIGNVYYLLYKHNKIKLLFFISLIFLIFSIDYLIQMHYLFVNELVMVIISLIAFCFAFKKIFSNK